MSDITALSRKDVDILENSLTSLSTGMTSVTDAIVDINGRMNNFKDQVEDIRQNVTSLESEIRAFMLEIKSTTGVSNAQNEILLAENKLNKKFGHYDQIRRKINGIINAVTLNQVNKSTLLTQSEETILNTPDYYLSYALSALCYWFRDDKKNANKALNKALKLNNSRTSLLFCLIHLKLQRYETSYKWMKRYLSSVNPYEMDNLIISILDSITNNVYNDKINELLISYINDWSNRLNNDNKIIEKQKERWIIFCEENREIVRKEEYPYLYDYSSDFEIEKKKLENAYTYYNIENSINKILNNKVNNSKSIDILINELIFSYDSDELLLRQDILKNKILIDNNGDKILSDKQYEKEKSSLNNINDFYTHLTNIIFDRDDVSDNTKKFAIAIMKEKILETIDTSLENKRSTEIHIKINDWEGTTFNGSNEIELKESIQKHVRNKNIPLPDVTKNPKIIYSVIFTIIGLIVAFLQLFIGVCITVIGLIAFFYFIYLSKQEEKLLMNNINKEIDDYLFDLYNVLSEIVDINYEIKKSSKLKENLKAEIISFNKENYLNGKVR